jgi:hypothetical protein
VWGLVQRPQTGGVPSADRPPDPLRTSRDENHEVHPGTR